MDDVTGKPAASELIVDVQFGPTGRVLLPVCREPGVHAHDAPPCVDIPGLRPLRGAGQPKAPGQPRPPPSFMMGAAGWWLPRQAESCRGELPTPGETPGRAVQLPSLRPGSGPGCQTANRTGASGSLTTPGRRGAALHSPRGAESRPCGLRRNDEWRGSGGLCTGRGLLFSAP